MNNLLSKIIRKIGKKYYCYNSNSKTKVYISYITDPFYCAFDKKLIRSHQSKSEILALASVLKSINIAFMIENHNAKPRFTNVFFDIVWGIEPNFEIMARNNKDAKKIYYATGAYWKHQNQMIIKRTNDVNNKYNSKIEYTRLVPEHNSPDIADTIVQIGSKYTIETYPEHLRKKIILIDQSSFDFCDFDINTKKRCFDRNHFVWFGSGGTVLKGLDLVLEFFATNPNLTLHVIGPIDSEFAKQIMPHFIDCKNIQTYGYMDVASAEFRSVINKCTFLVYPSASEGGCPGSVITLMKLGIIPIVSKYSAFEGLEQIGYILDDLTTDEIEKKISLTYNLSMDEIHRKISESSSIANQKFTIEKYTTQMKELFNSITHE